MFRHLFVLSLFLTTTATQAQELFVASPTGFKVEGRPELSSSVAFNGSEVRLANRGMVVSEKANVFDVGAEVSATVTFLEGDGTYADSLSVAFHTDGKRAPKYGEVASGIVVAFESHVDRIVIRHMIPEAKDGNPILAQVDGITMENGKPYSIRVVERRGKVTVEFDGKEVLAATIPVDAVFQGHYVALYNREPNAGVRKVTRLEKLILKALE